jgi:hypothetical protein
LRIHRGNEDDESACIELLGQLNDSATSPLNGCNVAIRARRVKGALSEYYALLAVVASQLAWFVAAFKKPSKECLSFTRATLDFAPDIFSRNEAVPCLDLCIVSDDITDHMPEDKGSCWNQIFTGLNVAVGFSIPPRPHQMFGVEVPLAVMTAFAEVEYPVAYKKGYVLKGWQNALFPVHTNPSFGLPASALQWHLFRSKRHRLYMAEAKKEKPGLAPIESKLSQENFIMAVGQTERHFLGLYGESRIRIGTNESQTDQITEVHVNDRLGEILLRSPVEWLRTISPSFGGGAFGASAGVSTAIRVRKTKERMMSLGVERIHRDLINAACANSTILYDVSARVAWMLPQICIVMYLLQAWTRANYPHIQVDYPTFRDMRSNGLEDALRHFFQNHPGIELREKFNYFVRVLDRLQDEEDLKPARRLHPTRLAGVDFATLTREDRFSILTTKINAESGGKWLQMLKSDWKDYTTRNACICPVEKGTPPFNASAKAPYRVITLFCDRLDPQPILPMNEVCDTWFPPPVDQDYLIISMYCLQTLSRLYGTGPVKLSREHIWKRGICYPYQRFTGLHRPCNRLQGIVTYNQKYYGQDQSISRLIQNTDPEAAVVFGRTFGVDSQSHCTTVPAQQQNAPPTRSVQMTSVGVAAATIETGEVTELPSSSVTKSKRGPARHADEHFQPGVDLQEVEQVGGG